MTKKEASLFPLHFEEVTPANHRFFPVPSLRGTRQRVPVAALGGDQAYGRERSFLLG